MSLWKKYPSLGIRKVSNCVLFTAAATKAVPVILYFAILALLFFTLLFVDWQVLYSWMWLTELWVDTTQHSRTEVCSRRITWLWLAIWWTSIHYVMQLRFILCEWQKILHLRHVSCLTANCSSIDVRVHVYINKQIACCDNWVWFRNPVWNEGLQKRWVGGAFGQSPTNTSK